MSASVHQKCKTIDIGIAQFQPFSRLLPPFPAHSPAALYRLLPSSPALRRFSYATPPRACGLLAQEQMASGTSTPRRTYPPPRAERRAAARPWSLGLGANVVAGGVRFRVWAPKPKRVEVVLESDASRTVALEPDRSGYFTGLVEGARAGDLYRYRLDGRDVYPDPCSRFQPDGPHGPSQVVDARTYRWQHASPPAVQLAGQVIYELHVGTFTAEGTYR